MHKKRHYPVGAELTNSGVHFRAWAPSAKKMYVTINNNSERFLMEQEDVGYHSVTVPAAKHGDLYQFQLDDDEHLYPDPASRAQPKGPHGPSMIVDSATFIWSDDKWQGVQHQNNVIYEMHIGTFTRAGTFRAAAMEFNELVKLGITIIELMPVNEFDGKFGWESIFDCYKSIRRGFHAHPAF